MKTSNILITELFLVKADWNRTFMGQIIREKINGKDVIRGNVVVNEGKIWASANTQDELGRRLDEICTLKLDHRINENPGISVIIAEQPFFLN